MEINSNKLLLILIFLILEVCTENVGILDVMLIGLFGHGNAIILPFVVPKNIVFKLLHS